MIPKQKLAIRSAMYNPCDKIRPYYIRRKDTKDTIVRYIVLFPEVQADSCQHYSE